jgi:hypothetical protein
MLEFILFIVLVVVALFAWNKYFPTKPPRSGSGRGGSGTPPGDADDTGPQSPQ